MEARNVRVNLFPIHAEMKAFLWTIESMKNLRQFEVTFATNCSQLVKMISKSEELLAFANYLENIKILKQHFHSSEIIYVPRTHNTKADRLEHC